MPTKKGKSTDSESSSLAGVLEMLQEQNRSMQEQHKAQQKMLLEMIEKQRVAHEQEMRALKDGRKEGTEDSSKVKLPKPTLQKLASTDNVEHFLATFERIATQQKWPKEVWATQVAGLLTGKAMAAYAALTPGDAVTYEKVKEAILRRYEINEETYRQRFRQDRKKGEESYREYADRLGDHFTRWTDSQSIPLKELIMLEQFLTGVPEDLRIWLCERKPTSLRQAATLADDHALARKSSQRNSGRPIPFPMSPASNTRLLENSANSNQRDRLLNNSNSNRRSQTNNQGDKKCFQCGKFGHLMYSCPERQGQDIKSALSGKGCNEIAWNKGSQKFLRRGMLNGKPVQMLIDTGCTKTMVSADYLPADRLDHSNKERILCVHGDEVCYPTAEVRLKLGRWSQKSRVVVAPGIPVPVLLGTDIYDLPLNNPVMVTTRNQAKKDHNLVTNTEEGTSEERPPELTSSNEIVEDIPVMDAPNSNLQEEEVVEQRREEEPTLMPQGLNPLEANVDDIKLWQAADPTLAKAREEAGNEESEKDIRVGFYYSDGLLYRKWRPEGSTEGDVRTCQQLVLPQQCRLPVLRLAHDVPMAGHMGITRTKDRLLQRYYWPGIFSDTANYCRSCEVCQKSNPKYPIRAKMVSMPLIEQPFQRIAMDVIGPLPCTQRGNRFILSICDYATRYPEAIALPSVEAPRVAKELVNLFSHMGVPDEILTDQGTNFMSSLLEEVYYLLHIKRIRTTPYHPQTDGLVERFNGTLKGMLRKFVSRNKKDWDQYLPYLLFAYREVPQETTGFSPFELLFGRRVRGPLDVLKEEWTGDRGTAVPVATHVVEMRERLVEMTQLVSENAAKSQQKQRRYYDQGAKSRRFDVGDQVLVLLPTTANRLKLHWTGPYKVTRKVGTVDYEIEMPGRRQERKIYHVNLMKKWHVMTPQPVLLVADLETEEETSESSSGEHESWSEEMSDWGHISAEQFFPLVENEGLQDMMLDIPEPQRGQLAKVLSSYPSVIANTPGRTTVVQHYITVGDAIPVQQKPYRIPYSQREVVKQELDQMLKARVIKPSTSPWASPIVLVTKKDGGVRFCVDYRKLNKVAKFDAYPMPRIEELIDTIGPAQVISTLDLAKGYWQIPMDQGSKDKTAFTTPFGLYEFEVMPFGLHSAPATFQRMINHVLRDCWSFARAYIDDIVVFSGSWEEHLTHLHKVLHCLEVANLTIKMSKCQFGRVEVHYLGHVIGGGEVRPDPEKLSAVRDYPTPISKKQVRAFLGLAGYYRRFVPHFSTIAEPLTELTKSRNPDRVKWTDDCEVAFCKLKEILVAPPVLKVVEPDKPYVLQTDASELGLGAVLSQVKDGEEHPVAFASRKLLPREKNYSVIEKECLAIVWSLQVFYVYLFGQKFTIETDHQPLSWLEKMKNANQRLTRWTLAVQPFCFEIHHRRGSLNKNADGLSRGALTSIGRVAVTTVQPQPSP